MLCIPTFPALHIALPSNEWTGRSFQMCECKRERECTWKSSLLGHQTSLLHLSLNGRVDREVLLTQENKTNSDSLTLEGFSGTNEKGKRNKMIGGGTPESHRANFKIVKLPSRQKANTQHTSGWIIYKVVKHQKNDDQMIFNVPSDPNNSMIRSQEIIWQQTQHQVSDTHCTWFEIDT